MTTTMNTETPVKGLNSNTETNNFINGIENGVCNVKCVASTTSVDGTGDYRITRRLECVWTSPMSNTGENIIDVEISGSKGATPVVTLNGQVVPASSINLMPGGMIEIRDLKGMLLDKVQIPVNNAIDGSTFAGNAYAGSAFAGYAGTTPKPFLGIAVRPISPDLAHNLPVDARNVCVVSEVIPGSAAFYAGLEPNDVLLSVNGKQANVVSLRHELDAAKIGQVLNLVVLCKGIKQEVQVALDGNTVNAGVGYPTAGNGSFGKTLFGQANPTFQAAQLPALGSTGIGWGIPAPKWAAPVSGSTTLPYQFDAAFTPICPVTGCGLNSEFIGYGPRFSSNASNWSKNPSLLGSLV